MSPETTYVLESAGTLVVFGGALWGAVWGLRRIGAPSGHGPLEIIARKPLDGRRAIYLVRVGRRVIVVGATDASLTRLAATSLDALDLASPAAAPPSTRFGDVVARVLRTDRSTRTR